MKKFARFKALSDLYDQYKFLFENISIANILSRSIFGFCQKVDHSFISTKRKAPPKRNTNKIGNLLQIKRSARLANDKNTFPHNMKSLDII